MSREAQRAQRRHNTRARRAAASAICSARAAASGRLHLRGAAMVQRCGLKANPWEQARRSRAHQARHRGERHCSSARRSASSSCCVSFFHVRWQSWCYGQPRQRWARKALYQRQALRCASAAYRDHAGVASLQWLGTVLKCSATREGSEREMSRSCLRRYLAHRANDTVVQDR